MKRRGISPVVATVLLIAIVVVIGLIVFLWFRGMVQESILKFDKNIELVCAEVSFDADYSGGDLSILNLGNVPIYKMKVKIYTEGGHETKNIEDFSDESNNAGWSWSGLNVGGTFSGENSGELNLAEEIFLIPVLLGDSDSGRKSYVCENEEYQIK